MDGAVLREWRRSRGWDVPETARRLRKAAIDGHLPTHDSLVTMVHRWERVGLSTERYELLYAKALGISPDDLPAGPIKRDIPPPLNNLDNPNLDNQGGDDPVDRREFGVAAMGALAGSLVAHPAKAPASVSREHVSELQRRAELLYSSDLEQVGGRSGLLRRATTLYASARNLLDNGTYTRAVGVDLQAVTAKLAAQAGFIAFDADEQQLARSLFTEEALLAGSAGSPLLTANAFSLLALQSAHLAAREGSNRTGLAREALRFLDQAAGAARYEASPKMHTIIAMRRARAYGLLGDDREVRVNISAARRELERGDHPSDPYWTTFVTQAEVTAHEAMALLYLNRADYAAVLFRDVVDADAEPARNRAISQAWLASALSAAGDQREAVAEGMRLLPVLEGEVVSARTVNQLRLVRQQERPGTEFAVRFDALAAAL